MKKIYFPFFILILFTAVNAQADWQRDVTKMLKADKEEHVDKYLARILEAAPSCKDVAAFIGTMQFDDAEKKGFVVCKNMCIDNKERPWMLYIPGGYDSDVPTPLIVALHGGVSQAEIDDLDDLTWFKEHYFTSLAEKRNWFIAFPMGQRGATWWDDVGMTNIRTIVRTVKQKFNIDDDRVYMGGFSDGGSGSYEYAMVEPTDYAAFFALNGHMGVASLDGDIPLYAVNLFNTPVYCTFTDNDIFYPTNKMKPTIDMALDAGGKLFYREFVGEHNTSFLKDEMPVIEKFMDRHIRDPFPTQIIWESAEKIFGQCRWFGITKITTDPPQPWHKDYNVAMVDEYLMIGFQPDYDYEGDGVKIASVVDEDTVARRMGLKADDIILECNGYHTKDIKAMNEFKRNTKRGDAVQITVDRDGKQLTFKDRFPDPETYFCFKRDKPSALAKVSVAANQIYIDASRVGGFKVLIHPDMFDPNNPILIKVNNEVLFNKQVKPDLEFMLRNFLKNRDRKLLYIAELNIML